MIGKTPDGSYGIWQFVIDFVRTVSRCEKRRQVTLASKIFDSGVAFETKPV
jgi:hypothetical protein